MIQKIVLTGVCGAIIGILAFYAAITVTIIPGVAAIYPATAFEVVFGAWFGIWGAIASYLGLLIAGTLGGWFPLPIGVFVSLSDFWMAMVPAILVRYTKFSVNELTVGAVIKFVIVTIVLGSLPGSLYYNYINLQIGIVPDWEAFWLAVFAWNFGNAVIITFVAVPLLRFFSVTVQRLDLFIEKML